MSKNLYEQAIADAKKLKEVAEQNAKNAIIEAITPRVRELIDNELSGNTNKIGNNRINESFDSFDDDDDIELDESAIFELANEVKKAKNKKKEDIDESSLLSQLVFEADEDDSTDEDEHINEFENNKDEDMNELNELLNEIKMEIDLEVEDEDLEAKLLELMPTIKFVDEDEDEEGDEDMDMDMDDMDMDDEDAGDMELPDMDMDDMDMGDEEESEEDVEESWMIDENVLKQELRKLRESKSRTKRKRGSQINESRNSATLIKEQRTNRSLRLKLEKYKGAIVGLRDQLNETNLFNAKLLSVNKLLQTKGLDVSQKKTIIETIDSAESLREVELLFNTLTESINKKGSTLTESRKRMIGSSSRPTRRSGATNTLNEGNQIDRWATLAGITKETK